MPSARTLLLVVPLVLLMQGCGSLFGPDGYFRDRGDDYLKAQTIEPITLSRDLSGDSIGQLFVIPPSAEAGSLPPGASFDVPRPAGGAAVVEQRNEVKIQKLGDRNWITVNSAPDAVWPRVAGFLAERGLGVASQIPARGLIETGWLAQQSDDASRDRYRIEILQGIRLNSTEIQVRQVTLPVGAAKGEIEWPPQSVSSDRELWMVRELAAYLARQDTVQASMLAQSIATHSERVSVVSGRGEPFLLLQVDQARAWASISGALNREGFKIEQAQRDQGLWMVSYRENAPAVNDSEESEGSDGDGLWQRFARIFDVTGDQPVAEDGTGAVAYRVVLQQQSPESVVARIQDATGKPLPVRDADALLRKIRVNLL